MKEEGVGSFFILVTLVLAGFALQAYLVQTGHQELVYGYILGVLVYQTLIDPQWFKEILEPDNVLSVILWVMFPFVATFGMGWRLVFVEK